MPLIQTFLRPGHTAPANLFGLADNALGLFRSQGFRGPLSLPEARFAVDRFVGLVRDDPERAVREHLGTSKKSHGPRMREFHRALFRRMDPDDWRLDGDFALAVKDGKSPQGYLRRAAAFLSVAMLGGQSAEPLDPEAVGDLNLACRERLLRLPAFVCAFRDRSDFVCDEAEAIDPLYGLATLSATAPLLSSLTLTGGDRDDLHAHLLHFVWLHQMENYWTPPALVIHNPPAMRLVEALQGLESDVRKGRLVRDLLENFASRDLYELGYFLEIYMRAAKIHGSDRLLLADIRKRFAAYAAFLERDDRFLSHAFLGRLFARVPAAAVASKRPDGSPLFLALARLTRALEAAASVADADGEREIEIFRWTSAEWLRSLEHILRRTPADKIAARVDDEAATLERRLRRLGEEDYATSVFEKESPTIFQHWGR